MVSGEQRTNENKVDNAASGNTNPSSGSKPKEDKRTEEEKFLLNKQLALMFNIQEIANKNDGASEYYLGRKSITAGLKNRQPTGKQIPNFIDEWNNIYPFRTVDLGEKMSPADWIKAFAELKRGRQTKTPPISDHEIIEFLESLTTLQISSMMPYVAIYKVTSESGAGRDSCGYQLMLHRGNFERLGTGQKLLEFFNGQRETIGGYGLESLTLEQHTSTKSNFSFNKYLVNLRMIFNSVEDFAVSKYVNNKGQEYSAAEVLCGLEKTTLNNNGNPMTYLTVMELGYTVEDEALKTYFSNLKMPIPRVKEILASLQLKLFLSVVKQSPQVTQEGTVEIEIEYVGWTEATQSQEVSNILGTPSKLKEYEEYKKKTGGITVDRRDHGTFAAAAQKAMSNKSGFNDALVWLDNFEWDTYLVFTKRLFNHNKLKIAYTDIENVSKAQSRAMDQMLKGTVVPVSEEDRKKLDLEIVPYNGQFGLESSTQYEVARARGAGSDYKASAGLKEVPSRLLSLPAVRAVTGLTTERTEVFDSPVIPIPYFYFSDLIGAVLPSMLQSTYETMNLPISVTLNFGEISFLNPRQPFIDSPFQYGLYSNMANLVGKASPTPNYLQLSLADIPISYEMYTNWFNQNVVAKKRMTYTFREFVEDVMNSILTYALNNSSEGFNWEQVAELRGVKGFSAQKYQTKAYTDYEIVEQDGKKLLKIFLYFHVNETVEEYLKKKATGNKELDRERGIIWLAYGKDQGMVIRAEFQRQNNPILRSSLIVKAEQSARTNNQADFDTNQRLSQMREIYGVDLTLLGNSWMQPGQVVCVQPTILGAGDINSKQNVIFQILGMGGYYTLVSNKLQFRDGLFTNTLHGIWHGVPFDRITTYAQEKELLGQSQIAAEKAKK